MAFSPHGKVEVTVFSFENQSWYSQGVAVTDTRVPLGGWGSVPPARLSPHTGRAAAACSGSRGPGGQRGQVCCSPTLLLAASGPGGRKWGLGAPKAHCAFGLFFHGGCNFFC